MRILNSYPSAYVHGVFGDTNTDARTRVNVEILHNAVVAVERLSTKLRFCMLQSGAKGSPSTYFTIKMSD